MTRQERAARIAEAIAWLCEDGGRLGGWGEDRLAAEDKLATALLESLLLAYPAINLVAVMAACRVHWVGKGQGTTTPRAWCRRIQNWAKCGAKWGDPLVVGLTTDHRPPTTGYRPGSAANGQPSVISKNEEPNEDAVRRGIEGLRRAVGVTQ